MALVRLDVADGVATVTLNDPDRRNVLSIALAREVVDVFDRIDDDPEVGAVVVTGEPPAFCAGAELAHLSTSAAGEGDVERSLRAVYEGFLRIGRSPLPTIAAVNGAAVGAGMNLALVCDVRVAGSKARFDTRFLDLGIHPGGGHTWMLRRTVGPQAAAAMVLCGEVLDGAEAERVGLVWRCVADEELLDTAKALATRAASAPRELLTRTKATIADMATFTDHGEAVDRELVPQAWSLAQPAFREWMAALRARIGSS